VPQKIYLKWVRQQLEDEQACLELPLTILLLFSFSVMAVLSLNQDAVYAVEQAIEQDVIENSNFAFSSYMGHKSFEDAHSFADVWSWLRLGMIPLVVQPSWSYSESRADDVASVFELSRGAFVDPNEQWTMSTGSKLPLTGDYLHYNKIIGGIRFRQQEAPKSYKTCKFPGVLSHQNWERWYGKPCMPAYNELSFQPDSSNAEVFSDPARVEWMVTDLDNFDRMIAQLVDMEDGCAELEAKNRTECFCKWCQTQDPASPWLTEQTQRFEVGMATYNSEYGLLTLTGVNFWFGRGGRMWKRVELMSSWVDFSQPTVNNLALLTFEACWIILLLYILINEGKEVIHVIANADTTWWQALQEDYIGLWNVVDWISIIVASAVMGCLFSLFMQTRKLHVEMKIILGADAAEMGREAYTGMVAAFFTSFEQVCAQEKTYRLSLCIYPMMMMLRLFKSFAAQPRLAVVTKTLFEASQDMLHFGIVLASVIFTLCIDAVLLFGRDIEDFGTFARSMVTAFRMMFGDWDWEPVEKVNRAGSYFWFSLFMIFIVIILLNMLLAIIMDNYMNVKKRSAAAQSLGKQISEMWRRRQMLKRKERVRLNDIWDSFLDNANGRMKAMCKSERPITAGFLLDLVPDIPPSQAARTLQNSWAEHVKATSRPFEMETATPSLVHLEALTRQIRNALFFAYDRVELTDTRPVPKMEDMDGTYEKVLGRLVMQEAESENELLERLKERLLLEEEQSKTVVDIVDKETTRLSSETAMALAGTLQTLDTRQARIEERQASIKESVREMYQTMMTLQSRALTLASDLERIRFQRSSNVRMKARSNWRAGIFDGCSPEMKEGAIPAVH